MARKYPVQNKIILASVVLMLAAFAGCPSGSDNQPTAVNPADKDLESQAALIIQRGLSSSNPVIRANAIEIAAGTGNKQFMAQVQQLLNDEFVHIRFAAAVAIGDTKYSAGRNDVAQLLKDKDENVRLAASYAIVMLTGNNLYFQQITAALNSTNQRARANAAFLLGKIGDKKVLPQLYNTIRDETSDERTRLNSIEAIARLGDEKIYQKLWAMLISAYADDRVFGIRGMGAMKTAQAKDSILTMFKDDLPEVRLVAAEQLGCMGDTEGEKIVIDALTKDIANAQDPESKARIQTLAALAIGQIRTPAVKKFLPELLKNHSQFVQLAAAKAVFLSADSNNIGR
jgi:HEAT repeat protein